MEDQLKIARAWVLEYGQDCDGYWTRGSVSAYSRLDWAQSGLEEARFWSDGMRYSLTEKWSDVVQYCEEHEKDCDNYIYADKYEEPSEQADDELITH